MAHVSASLIISPVAFVVFTVLAGRRLAYWVPALGVEPSIELCMWAYKSPTRRKSPPEPPAPGSCHPGRKRAFHWSAVVCLTSIPPVIRCSGQLAHPPSPGWRLRRSTSEKPS